MREVFRERGSDSARVEKRRDFRDNLHSIFVDNLNEKVDLLCLWGLFKTFGKVRDIHLSEANMGRKRGFASVRFATLEEARRVAEKTKGMHVYGWPIDVKVAQFGWNHRRHEGGRVEMRDKMEMRNKMERYKLEGRATDRDNRGDKWKV